MTKKQTDADDLNQWMRDEFFNMDYLIDEVLEFLADRKCLTKKGLTLKKKYWKKYIEDKYE